jgi:hypothetical protein
MMGRKMRTKLEMRILLPLHGPCYPRTASQESPHVNRVLERRTNLMLSFRRRKSNPKPSDYPLPRTVSEAVHRVFYVGKG